MPRVIRRVQSTLGRAARRFAARRPVEPRPIVLPPGRTRRASARYLAAVAIARNEGPYLGEWIEFHRLAGIEHIFLYDDGSTDGTAGSMRPYVEAGLVTCIPWAQFDASVGQQRHAYAHALCTFGPDWRWMAFIDVDEFLFAASDEALSSAIARYEDLPAVAVPWLVFGFGGHARRPPGLVIESYTTRAPFPPAADAIRLQRWKCIVDPSQVEAVDGVHFFVLPGGRHGAYDEKRAWIPKRPNPAVVRRASCDVFRLNHYFTKSEEEFAVKRARPTSAAKPGKAIERLRDRRDAVVAALSRGAVDDTAIQRFLPELRRRLKDVTPV